VDPRARPRAHRQHGDLDGRPGDRGRALHQPRHRVRPGSGRDRLRLPGPGAVPGLPPPHVRPADARPPLLPLPHKPSNPRHQAANPAHPRTVQAPETLLDAITGRFFRDRVFTPARGELLAVQLPASDAEAAARRDTAAAALAAQVRKLSAQQDAQVRALEDVPEGPAAKDMRARINERFAQLHTQRTTAENQLAALAAEQPRAADPAILDEIPYAGDILPGLPPDLKARLFAAFDLSILWNKPMGQATVTVTITDATLTALPGILNPRQDGYHDTASADHNEPVRPAAVRHLARTPIAPKTLYVHDLSWLI
jgi:hypothetical protein